MTASHLDVRLLNQSRKAIGELIDARTELVASGQLEDYATYRSRAGELEGLKTALRIMEDLVFQMGNL